MNPEVWKKVEEIYSAAIERPPDERLSYISDACQGDETLESELRRLLAASADDEGFLEHPLSLIAGVLPEFREFVPRLQPGDVLCERFEVVRFLAHGGMGEVYEAYDRVLHEPAAIKTIRPEIASHTRVVEQFKQEVRRARAIRSDHVCPVFDVFLDRTQAKPLIFLTMQLLQGETLASRLRRRGPLDAAEALPLLRQLAEGLDAAHRVEIVHGDLKASNVMLVRTKTGTMGASITDFGLARGAVAYDDPDEPKVEALPAGGTPEYMAPEQVEGFAPTRASDIYSLGLIAFEMGTGRLPFEGSTPEESAQKRLRERPPSPRSLVPALPKTWDPAIERCLAQEQSERYATALEFVNALEGGPPKGASRRSGAWPLILGLVLALIAAAAAWQMARTRQAPSPVDAPLNSLAVIPFHLIDKQQEGDYFTDAFTEDLTHALGSLRDLQVVGPESARKVKLATLPPAEAGQRLGVSYLLSGSVGRSLGKVRVLTRLVSAPDGVQIWSRDYDRDEKKLFEIRQEISRDVARTLNITLAGMQTTGAGASNDLEAQDLYWMGRHYWRQRTDPAVRRSLELFEQATTRDPSFAAGWTGLADAYSVIAERNMIAPAEALPKASHAARTAVSLDPRLAEAWVSLGQVTSLYDRNFNEAERCFRQALDIHPRLSTAHQWYSYMLVKQRRFAEAIHHARQALASEPFSLPANINLTVVLFYAGKDDEALAQCKKLADMEATTFFNHLVAAQILARRGQAAAALAEMEQVREDAKAHPLTVRFRAEMYAILHRGAEAEDSLAKLTAMRDRGRVPATYVASVFATLGNRDKAFEWLETAYREYDGLLSSIHAAPGFDSIRSDPRYAPLLGRIGLTAGTPSGSSPPR